MRVFPAFPPLQPTMGGGPGRDPPQTEKKSSSTLVKENVINS